MIDSPFQAMQAGRWDLARAMARRAAILAADDADAFHLLGILAGQSGQQQESLALVGRAIRIADDNARFHANLAAMLFNSGHAAEAAVLVRRILARDPPAAEAWYSIARICNRLGRPELALPAYRRHLRLCPDHGESGRQLASLLYSRGRVLEAAVLSTYVLALRPDCAHSHFLLAQASRAISEASDVERAFRRALALDPGFTEVLCSLGAVREGRDQDSSTLYRTALALKPDIGGALVNLGRRHWRARRPGKAITLYRRAAAVDPSDANARCNLAASLLASGRYDEGWEQYEWRWQDEGFVRLDRHFSQPRWTGGALGRRVLLIHAEQGLGDMLQFCRFATAVAKTGRVVLEAYQPLVRLLSGLPAVETVVAQGEPLPDFDFHCPLLSLPRLLGTTLDSIPPAPYLVAEPRAVASWQERLGDPVGLRTGLVWSGGPHAGRRSMPFDALRPLLAIPGIRWFSLQVGERAGDAAEVRQIEDLTPLLSDFAETAAALMCLDLVITVDTAVAHLAGGLGRPTWILLPFNGDWRWLLDRQDSPWYPTVRLFRQRREGDWPGVVAQVGAALTAELPVF